MPYRANLLRIDDHARKNRAQVKASEATQEGSEQVAKSGKQLVALHHVV